MLLTCNRATKHRGEAVAAGVVNCHPFRLPLLFRSFPGSDVRPLPHVEGVPSYLGEAVLREPALQRLELRIDMEELALVVCEVGGDDGSF